jgi:hypothetical protein
MVLAACDAGGSNAPRDSTDGSADAGQDETAHDVEASETVGDGDAEPGDGEGEGDASGETEADGDAEDDAPDEAAADALEDDAPDEATEDASEDDAPDETTEDASGDTPGGDDGEAGPEPCADVEPGSGGEGEPCAKTANCDGRQYCNLTRCACWPPGECVRAEDCGDPGNDWPHDDCDGWAACEAGLCAWICG